MTTSTPELLTTAQSCERLDVDRATLIRWVQSGIAEAAMKLPGPNGTYLFAPAEIERLLELRGDRKQMPKGLASSLEASA